MVNQDGGPSRDEARAAGRGGARFMPGDTLLAAPAQGPSRRQSRGRTGDITGYTLAPAVHLGKNLLISQGMRRPYQIHFQKLNTNQE